MEKILMGMVSGDQVVTWLIIFLAVFASGMAYLPKIVSWIAGKVRKETLTETGTRSMEQRLDAIERDIKEIKHTISTEVRTKLDRDYERMNEFERQQKRDYELQRESLEERQIIMKALLGVIGGLQELGTNGPTKEAEMEIRQYLNAQAHKPRMED